MQIVKYNFKMLDGTKIVMEYDPAMYKFEISPSGEKLTIRKLGTRKRLKVINPLFVVQTKENQFVFDRRYENSRDMGIFQTAMYGVDSYGNSSKPGFYLSCNSLYHEIVSFDKCRVLDGTFLFKGKDYNGEYILGDVVYNAQKDSYLKSEEGMKIEAVSTHLEETILSVQETISYHSSLTSPCKDILLYKMDPQKFTYINDICSIVRGTCIDHTTGLTIEEAHEQGFYNEAISYLKGQAATRNKQYQKQK